MSKYLDSRFLKLEPYVPGEQPRGQQFVKLNTNESPFPPSPAVQEAVARQAGLLNLYPDPTARDLTEALAGMLEVGPEQVFVGNGSDEVLAFCFQALCPNGAAFPDLTYGFYPVYAALYDCPAEVIPLREDFTLAPEDYYGVGRTVFIANPNAPTGIALSREQVAQVLEQNRDSLVVVDEAYVHFGAQTAVPLLGQYDNLLVVGTFSKSRSMAGARLGYAAGSAALIADLNRIRNSFNPYNVNRMTLAAGAAAAGDRDYYDRCCRTIMETREKTLARLGEKGFICTASMANFVFVTHPKVQAEALYLSLKQQGVLVRWFNKQRIQNHLRITIGTEAQMEVLFGLLDGLV